MHLKTRQMIFKDRALYDTPESTGDFQVDGRSVNHPPSLKLPEEPLRAKLESRLSLPSTGSCKSLFIVSPRDVSPVFDRSDQ